MSSSEGPTGKATKRARARRPAKADEAAPSRVKAALSDRTQAGSSAEAPPRARDDQGTAASRGGVAAPPPRVADSAASAGVPTAHARRVRVSRQSSVRPADPESSEPAAPRTPANDRALEAAVPGTAANEWRTPQPSARAPQSSPKQLTLHAAATASAAAAQGDGVASDADPATRVGAARRDGSASHAAEAAAHGGAAARAEITSHGAEASRAEAVWRLEVASHADASLRTDSSARVSDRSAPHASRAGLGGSDAEAPRPLARVAAHELAEPRAPASTRAHASVDLADDFGLDAVYEARMRPWFESLCRHYVKVDVRGVEHIPADGRALLVANHTRAPLWDGIILRTALRLHHAAHRCPRWLVDDRQYHAPFLGTFVNRLGAVRACQENAERLLQNDELVAVFPEGANGANRRYEDRHRLQRFGRGGFVKLALRTGTPVIPIAIVTCDHTLPAWQSRINRASRTLRAPFSALTSGRSPLGLLSVPPITSPVRIVVGEPVVEITRQGAHAIEDDGLVHELNECVRGAVQELVNATLRS